MLPARVRMRRGADFATTIRRGRRAAAPTLVAHAVPSRAVPSSCLDEPQVGFVVSRAVGTAVTRNLVRRRLRHLVRDRLDQLPAGTALVIRALPAAAAASADDLGRDLDRALARALPAAGGAR